MPRKVRIPKDPKILTGGISNNYVQGGSRTVIEDFRSLEHVIHGVVFGTVCQLQIERVKGN